jgi:hypothetical protein
MDNEELIMVLALMGAVLILVIMVGVLGYGSSR